MSGTLSSLEEGIEAATQRRIKGYDEEAEFLIRGQVSAREGVRDFGVEHAAYLATRGKVDEVKIEIEEVVGEEKTDREDGEDGEIARTHSPRRVRAIKEVDKEEEPVQQDVNGEPKKESEAEKRPITPIKEWLWKLRDGAIARLGFRKGDEPGPKKMS